MNPRSSLLQRVLDGRSDANLRFDELRGLLRENKKKAVGWMENEGRAKLAQDGARARADWVRDDFDSPECQALIDGRSSPR